MRIQLAELLLLSAMACAPAPPASPSQRLSTLVDVAYGPDARQKLDVYLPSRAVTATFLFVHGGSFTSGDKASYGSVGHSLALAGVATVIVDYRLVPRVRPTEQAKDVARAVAYIHEHGAALGLSARLVLGGHSAGAHLAALVATDRSYLRAFGRAPSELAGLVLLSGIYDPATARGLDAVFTKEERMEASPLRKLDRCSAPLLLAVGEREPEWLQLQTRHFYDAEVAAGCSAELDLVPGADHRDVLLDMVTPGSPTATKITRFVRAP